MNPWVETIPVLRDFAKAADDSIYRPLPDDWHVGVSDVVDSTRAIADGRYRAVNLAGAGTISAVTNALGGDLPLYTFGGDGARFAVPPEYVEAAADALARVSMWARRDLDLDLRVGMTTVSAMRAEGHEIRVAFWQASPDVRYALFSGGGVEWVDDQLKGDGGIAIPAADPSKDPDLSGLSCQWGAISPAHGSILSLIVRRGAAADPASFLAVTENVVSTLEAAGCMNPVPAAGPSVKWPGRTIDMQSRIASTRLPRWIRRPWVTATTVLYWLIFKLGVRLGSFDAHRYRRQVASNTDFRKFDGGLIMTVDCSTEVAESLRGILDQAAAAGTVRYGMHLQDQAQITCFVPSALSADHVHFVDGSGGGYAAAASRIGNQPRPR